jgi:type 1 fimbria pilin
MTMCLPLSLALILLAAACPARAGCVAAADGATHIAATTRASRLSFQPGTLVAVQPVALAKLGTAHVIRAKLWSGCGAAGDSSASVMLAPVRPSTGQTYVDADGTHLVFDTGVAGIGYALAAADDRGASYQALSAVPTRLRTGPYLDGLGITAVFKVLLTAALPAGSYVVAAQPVGTLYPSTLTGRNEDGARTELWVDGFTVIVKRPTCSMNAGDRHRMVILPTVKPEDFTGADGRFPPQGEQRFAIGVSDCQGVAHASFSFSGAQDPFDAQRYKNTGTASGVGIWLYSADDGGTIGADGSHNTRSVEVVDNAATLRLGANYFRTGAAPVTPGSVKALVTIHMSYD